MLNYTHSGVQQHAFLLYACAKLYLSCTVWNILRDMVQYNVLFSTTKLQLNLLFIKEFGEGHNCHALSLYHGT